jgi:outer membrane receptor protein involved in Fe transport
MRSVLSARVGAVVGEFSRGTSFRRSPFLLVLLSARLLFTSRTGASEESPPSNVPGQAAVAQPDTTTSADEQAKKVRRSEEVVVTATRSEQSPEDVSMSVTLVPRAAIEATPSRTLDDALRTVVGLNLPLASSNVLQPINDHVSMRGLGGDRALVLLDGVPLNDPVMGYVQWNKAPLGEVDRVEVVRGAGASLFGNYAMGGTVNILTRPLGQDRLEADASYGTFDTQRLNAAVSGGLFSWLDAGVFADAEKTDGYIRPVPEERGAIDVPSRSRSLNLQVKAQTRGTEGWRAWVRGNVLDHDQGNGTPIDATHRRIYDLAAGGRIDTGRSETIFTLFTQKAGYSGDASLLVPGAGRDREYRGSHSERPGRDAGGSVQWSLPMAGPVSFVTAGLDVRHVSTDETVVSFNQTGVETLTRVTQGSQTFTGLFAEASAHPVHGLEVILSARWDGWKNTGGRDEAGPGTVTTYEDRSANQLDPRLSVRYVLNEALAVRGAAYRAFRAPSLSELYRSNVTRTFQIKANPELGPETLVGGEVGLDYASGRFKGQVNVFRNDVENLVVRATVSATPTLVVQPRNVGSARSQGVELIGSVALAPVLSLDAGYAYTDSVVTDNPANPALVGNQIPEVPRHAASLAVRWAPSRGPTITLRGRIQSKRYGDDANQLVEDPHGVLDLFASVPITAALEVFGSAENLLDREYVADVNVGRRLGPPRQLFLGLRLRVKGASPRAGS